MESAVRGTIGSRLAFLYTGLNRKYPRACAKGSEDMTEALNTRPKPFDMDVKSMHKPADIGQELPLAAL